jgi:hypothetical protein
MANRYTFETELEGFINVGEPSGKFNNCCFAFRLPQAVLEQAEHDREELLVWAKSKVTGRVNTNLPKWDDEGLVKISYGGDTGRPAPVFIDSEGSVLEDAVRKSIRKGTKVRLIVDQKPYTKPSLGTTLKVLGVQVLELASGAVTDSGDLSDDDVIALFAKSAGFKQSTPAPRAVEQHADEEDAAYDF